MSNLRVAIRRARTAVVCRIREVGFTAISDAADAVVEVRRAARDVAATTRARRTSDMRKRSTIVAAAAAVLRRIGQVGFASVRGIAVAAREARARASRVCARSAVATDACRVLQSAVAIVATRAAVRDGAEVDLAAVSRISVAILIR